MVLPVVDYGTSLVTSVLADPRDRAAIEGGHAEIT